MFCSVWYGTRKPRKRIFSICQIKFFHLDHGDIQLETLHETENVMILFYRLHFNIIFNQHFEIFVALKVSQRIRCFPESDNKCHDHHQILQVQWLLRHGAVIKSDKFGKTPLSDAAENKQLEVKVWLNKFSIRMSNSSRFCLCWCNTLMVRTGDIGGRVARKNRTSQMTPVLVKVLDDNNRLVFTS